MIVSAVVDALWLVVRRGTTCFRAFIALVVVLEDLLDRYRCEATHDPGEAASLSGAEY